MTDTDAPTTTFACPDWCDSVDCDSFAILTTTGVPTRAHEHVITKDNGLHVWVTAKEWLTPTGLVLEPATIGCDGDDFDGMREMTPAKAHDLEAALAAALALVHTIEAR